MNDHQQLDTKADRRRRTQDTTTTPRMRLRWNQAMGIMLMTALLGMVGAAITFALHLIP
jgi:hypothetical protein